MTDDPRIEAAAKAMWETTAHNPKYQWTDLERHQQLIWVRYSTAALAAADRISPASHDAIEAAFLIMMRDGHASVTRKTVGDVIAAGVAVERARCAKIAKNIFGGKAHTYASENADVYRAQDEACRRIAAAIRKGGTK